MNEPALKLGVGVDLDSLDRDFKKVVQQIGQVPKKVTVKIDADGTDQTVANVQKVRTGTEKLNEQIQRQVAVAIQAQRAIDDYDRAMGRHGNAMNAAIAANDNYAKSTSHVGDVLRVATKTAVDHAASWAVTAGAVGAGVLLLRSLMAVLGPIIIAYKLVKEAVDLATEAWSLGAAKLAEYVDIAKKAAGVDLSTSFFQKLTKGAEDSRAKVDDLTKALTTLQRQSADQLGGSPLDNRLGASVKAGNFAGNTGVSQYAAANTTEQKYQAIVSLIHQAMDAGQRLAALDIAGTAFGSEAADNLRKDSEYFDKIAAAAAKVSDKQIVSDADVGRALDLQNRYDAAVKILETRWHPIQDLLTQGGIKMHEVWVGMVETIASAVDWVTKLVGAIPAWVQRGLNAGGKFVVETTTTPASRQASEQSLGISSDPKAIADTAAVNAAAQAYDNYRGRLQNAAAWQQQMNEVSTIAGKVIKDTSRTIDDASKKVLDHKDALERAKDSIEKYIQTTNAAAQTVDASVFEQEKAKTIAQLTAAALRDGKTDLDQYAAAWQMIGNRAGDAAQKLELARVNSNIKFTRDTALLSPEDVQIATQLRRLYPDIATSLGSVQAQGMRVNNAILQGKDYALDFSKTLVQGLMQGKSGMDALVGAADALASKLADKGLTDLFSGDFIKGGLELGASLRVGTFTGDEKQKRQGNDNERPADDERKAA